MGSLQWLWLSAFIITQIQHRGIFTDTPSGKHQGIYNTQGFLEFPQVHEIVQSNRLSVCWNLLNISD